ncbi:porin PorA family protein, partial [Nocardia rhizosphaerihabitans]|uniref:porin PorA family protein n=1 Tax=Nocardia rhizosphaerihabitans TaxID=1691570 RepID=UPI0036715757
YTNTRDLWVEPRTGAVLKGGESIHLYYGRSANQVDVTALKSHLVFDEETIDAQMAVTQESLDKLDLFGKTLPIILGILAAILLIAGAVLGVMSAGGSTSRRTYDPPTEQLRSTNL